MKRLSILILTFASVALLGAGAATSTPPIHATATFVDVTFPDPVLSAACGTTVYITLDGTIKGTLFRDKSGNIVGEIDTQPGLRLTYSNDAGGSISFPWALVSHTDYSNGAAVGSLATVTLTGNAGSFTGFVGPGNGRIVLSGVVFAVDDNGVPLTAFTDLVSISGNFRSQTTAICGALA
jgi:hypothetical protein